MVDKSGKLPQDIEWHFIGHLQSNKAKVIVRDGEIFDQALLVCGIHIKDYFVLLGFDFSYIQYRTWLWWRVWIASSWRVSWIMQWESRVSLCE